MPLKVDSSGVIKIAYEDNRGGKWERTAEITVK
jgi:sulfur-oxidizing protein SoxZ